MIYNPPSGSTDPNAGYVGKNVAAGTQGSKVPGMAIEAVQREIVNCIQKAGLVPTNADLGQLWKALKAAAPDAALVHSGENTGSVNAIVANLSPKVTSLQKGTQYNIALNGPNTGPVTAKLDGTDAVPVLRSNGNPLQPRDISKVASLVFDGTNLILLNLAQEFAPPGSAFVGSKQMFGFVPQGGQHYLLTQPFVAPFSGTVRVTSILNSSPANQNIANGARINLNGNDIPGSADTVSGSLVSVVSAVVAKGDAVIVTSDVIAPATPTFSVSQYLVYEFLPG